MITNKNNPIGITLLILIIILSRILAIPLYLLITSVFGFLGFPTWTVYNLIISSLLLYIFYQHHQYQRNHTEQHQRILDRSYQAIHNGPLQTLKSLIRKVSSQETGSSPLILLPFLNQIDEELRNIYDFMQREASSNNAQIYLTKNYAIDLADPLHELLCQAYQNKLLEASHYFESINQKISDFCPMASDFLTLVHKEELIRFLEEALSNIEQHATEVTRLTITCKQEDGQNIIRIVDNGRCRDTASTLHQSGSGTKQANKLARRLSGQFSRQPAHPHGIVCQLTWPAFPHRL